MTSVQSAFFEGCSYLLKPLYHFLKPDPFSVKHDREPKKQIQLYITVILFFFLKGFLLKVNLLILS